MLPLEVVPVLIVAAILGYLAGHSSGGGGSSERRHTVKPANVALSYPPGWRMATIAPGIPELSIAGVIVIAPKNGAQHVGLMFGTFAARELAPLPARFVAALHRLPVPEVVNLVETQAYKYAQLSVPRYDKRLTLFVVPNPGGRANVFACYASAGHIAQMHACEQSVATVTVGEPPVYQLAPEPRYASVISAAISRLDRQRATLKRQLGIDVSAPTAQRVASELAEGFATAAGALDRLQPSPAVQRVHRALTDAARRAHDGYVTLAAAIAERDVTRYRAAQKAIARAEADVDAGLSSFVLLGYDSTALAGRGGAVGAGS